MYIKKNMFPWKQQADIGEFRTDVKNKLSSLIWVFNNIFS